ncbi:IclR family transcriptional regulator [Variovorax sp.]|uniref:IclR family transcriptional regulator n=1 Tax=Variovorax sp. TaxID=1871043 RepID=UPI002D49B3DF|nr:IclR family transcriptional regulator [Variovorax sp.]HYP82759.1 IclR family transcriptional regulator [Variovorax sp.]
MSNPQETPGAQNMRRALQVLRTLASHHGEGMGVTEVMSATGLERSTAHRLLTCLVEEQFADRDPLTRRYRLGLDAMRLGFASLTRAPVISTYEAHVQRLARISEDTVFLLVRQGDYSMCLKREDGAFPVKIFSTRVGDIRPLGIGVGGMAMLAALPDEEIEQITARHAAAFEAAGLTAERLSKVVARTRRSGYSEMLDTVTEGVAGVGAAILAGGATPFAAVSIASIKPRMSAARRAELAELLLQTLRAEPTAQPKTRRKA